MYQVICHCGLLDPYSLIISFGKTSQVEGNVYSCFSLKEKVIELKHLLVFIYLHVDGCI